MEYLVKETRNISYPAFDSQIIDIHTTNNAQDIGMNSSFTLAELQMDLNLLRRNTAPGPVKIT